MSTFTTIRIVSLAFLFLIHLLLLGFAAAAVSDCLHVVGNAPTSLIMTLINAVLMLLFVPMALSSLYFDTAFISHAWFECAWLVLLVILDFGTTIAVTTSGWSVFCHGKQQTMEHDSVYSDIMGPPCKQYQTLLSLSWMATVSTIVWCILATAYVSSRAWGDRDVWFLDMSEIKLATPEGDNEKEPKPKPQPMPKTKPSPLVRVQADDLWSDVNLYDGPATIADPNAPKSHFSMSTAAPGTSRRTTFWPLPQWARTTGKRGVTPAFPVRPTNPKTLLPPLRAPLYDTYRYRERSLPPTPVVTRPSNPEPPTPAIAYESIEIRQQTVSRLLREVESEVVQTHRAATQAALEGRSPSRMSTWSWNSRWTFKPQITPHADAQVSRWSKGTEADHPAIPRAHMSFLDRPFSSYRDERDAQGQSLAYSAPSVYSQRTTLPVPPPARAS